MTPPDRTPYRVAGAGSDLLPTMDREAVIETIHAMYEEYMRDEECDYTKINRLIEVAYGQVSAPSPSADAVRPGEALITMLAEAERFASWAAGEGLCPVDGQPARAPEDFLMDYSEATGEEDWETMADRLPGILAGQEAADEADGALASSTLGTGGPIPFPPPPKDPTHDQ